MTVSSYSLMAGPGVTSAYAPLLKASTAQISLLTVLPAPLRLAAQGAVRVAGRIGAAAQDVVATGVLIQALMWSSSMHPAAGFAARRVDDHLRGVDQTPPETSPPRPGTA